MVTLGLINVGQMSSIHGQVEDLWPLTSYRWPTSSSSPTTIRPTRGTAWWPGSAASPASRIQSIPAGSTHAVQAIARIGESVDRIDESRGIVDQVAASAADLEGRVGQFTGRAGRGPTGPQWTTACSASLKCWRANRLDEATCSRMSCSARSGSPSRRASRMARCSVMATAARSEG